MYPGKYWNTATLFPFSNFCPLFLVLVIRYYTNTLLLVKTLDSWWSLLCCYWRLILPTPATLAWLWWFRQSTKNICVATWLLLSKLKSGRNRYSKCSSEPSWGSEKINFGNSFISLRSFLSFSTCFPFFLSSQYKVIPQKFPWCFH